MLLHVYLDRVVIMSQLVVYVKGETVRWMIVQMKDGSCAVHVKSGSIWHVSS